MQDFVGLCRALNEALPLNKVPDHGDHGIQPITLFEDPNNLQMKAEKTFDKHKTHLASEDENLHLNCIGCYPVDQLKGGNLLTVLCDILKGDFQHGDCLYFSIDNKLISAVIIVKHSVLSVTINVVDQDEHFKRMYVKLFDNHKIEKQIEEYPDTKGFYQKEIISTWRQKAKSEYHNFLSQTFAQFTKDQTRNSFKFELWNSFFGMVVAVASRISRARIFPSTRSLFPCIDHIPYAACVKFAIDMNESGKVSELLGEIGYQNTRDVEKIQHHKAERIVSTAKFLISK